MIKLCVNCKKMADLFSVKI